MPCTFSAVNQNDVEKGSYCFCSELVQLLCKHDRQLTPLDSHLWDIKGDSLEVEALELYLFESSGQKGRRM